MRVYIPFVLMIGMNILIIRKIRQSKIKSKTVNINPVIIQNQNLSSNSLVNFVDAVSTGKMTGKEYKFMVSTITMDFIFLILYLPVAVNLTLNIVDIYMNLSNTELNAAAFSFYSNVSQLVAYLYHVIDIFMFMAFNKFFRDEFLLVFRLNGRKVQASVEGVGAGTGTATGAGGGTDSAGTNFKIRKSNS